MNECTEPAASSDASTVLLTKLTDQVDKLSDRISDLEEQVSDLSTDLRLQARRSTVAAQLLPLPLGQCSQEGSLNSVGCSAAASPRVAGPLSAAATPRGRYSSRPSSLVGSHPAQQQAPASRSTAAVPVAGIPAAAPPPAGVQPASADAAHQGTAATPQAAAAGTGGVFDALKVWGDGVMSDSRELKQALQLATAAAAAAAEAQAAADRCQQQVLELQGRQGQAERRLDTLWQLQETASSNQAALLQYQGQLEQQQQAIQQQQENMVALRAQVVQCDLSCGSYSAVCAELRSLQQQLQQQVDEVCSDTARQSDQLAELSQQQQDGTATLRAELASAQQDIHEQLQHRQVHLDSCAAAAASALGNCEHLRQGAVVLAGRLDAVAGQIRAAVDPLANRLSEVETAAAAWSKAAALSETFVQQEHLSARLAQLSTATARRDHERAQQVAGLAARLEELQGQVATRDEAVTQDCLQHKLADLQASTSAHLQAALQELQSALSSKADEAATAKITSNLAERFNSSETSLLLGLRALRDKTALLLSGKADTAALQVWQQGVDDSIAQLTLQGASRPSQVLQQPPRAGRPCQHLLSQHVQSAQPEEAAYAGFQTIAAAAWHQDDCVMHSTDASTGTGVSVSECVAGAEAALAGITQELLQDGATADNMSAVTASHTNRDDDSTSCVAITTHHRNICTPTSSSSSSTTTAAAGGSSPGAAHAKGRKGSTAHSLGAASSTGAGSLQRLHQQHVPQAPRPFSALQPWSAPHSPPSTSAADLHGAATNAKLVHAEQKREAARQQLASQCITRKPCVPLLKPGSSSGIATGSNSSSKEPPDTAAAAEGMEEGSTGVETLHVVSGSHSHRSTGSAVSSRKR